MVKLNNCTDCRVKLNEKNRSKLQSGIRCKSCFAGFLKKTTETLENMIADMDKQTLEGNKL